MGFAQGRTDLDSFAHRGLLVFPFALVLRGRVLELLRVPKQTLNLPQVVSVVSRFDGLMIAFNDGSRCPADGSGTLERGQNRS